ncbi:hypothetical protein WJ62_15915 [Burkholderia diffusa]|nr:hypothetical protein WJ62_15915 [Burkholderia diffusa]
MPDAVHPEFLEHARSQRIGLRLRIPGLIHAAIASTACHVMVLACRIASSESASPTAPAASNSKMVLAYRSMWFGAVDLRFDKHR